MARPPLKTCSQQTAEILPVAVDNMVSYVRCVRAYRGHCNEVADWHESLLRDVHMFFQRRVLVEDVGPLLDECRIISLPWVSDWYETSSEVQTRWVLERADEEEQLFRYVVQMYTLGIPTLLQEELHSRQLQKYWMSAKAFFVASGPSAARVEYWTDDERVRIKTDFVNFVVEGMIEAAQDFFGVAAVCKQLVAVLDSSGYCERVAGEILNIRVCFQGLAMSHAQLLQCRKFLVSRVEGVRMRERRLGWEACLRAMSSHEGRCETIEGGSLWEAVLQSPNGPQPLVWCEAASGLSNDQRPLKPFGLMVTDADGRIDSNPVEAKVTSEQWCSLGSVWINRIKATLDERILVC